jgi:hypothetical protein
LTNGNVDHCSLSTKVEDNNSPFNAGYREAEDGATSEEEVENGNQQSQAIPNPFPPLVEVKPAHDP